MWLYFADGSRKQCGDSSFGWYLDGREDHRPEEDNTNEEENAFGWYLERQSDDTRSETKNCNSCHVGPQELKTEVVLVEPKVQVEGVSSVQEARAQIEGNVVIGERDNTIIDNPSIEITQDADIEKFRKLEAIDSRAPSKENLNRLISGDSLESSVLSSILNITIDKPTPYQDDVEDAYNVDDGDAIFCKPFPKFLRLADFRNNNATGAAAVHLPLHLKVLRGYLHDSPKRSRKQKKVASLWEELNEVGPGKMQSLVCADSAGDIESAGNEMCFRKERPFQFADEFCGLDSTWKTLLKSLSRLEGKLFYLEIMTSDLHAELLNIRNNFMEEDLRITHLIKRSRTLTKELKEMYYFDNVLHLLSGNTEKVSKHNWPFKFKSDVRSENQNLIV